LLLTALIWGSTFVMAKDLLERWPPVAYITVRFVLAALVLVALFPRQIAKASTRDWRAGVTLGLLFGGGFALQAMGLVYTTPSRSAFMTGLTTPLVPVVAFFLFRIRPNMENMIGVTLASIGGMVILAPRAEGAVNAGDVLTLCGAVLFAFHIALLTVYARESDFKQLTVLQIAAAAVLFIGLSLVFRAVGAVSTAGLLPAFVAREYAEVVWSARAVSQLVYLAVVATVAAFLLWTWGQARTSETHAAIIFSLEPVFATGFAVAARGTGEWMDARGNTGAALILAGLIISELRLTAPRDQRT
jgi:drug/metabolite transporter (DMT)-like permease